MSMVLQVFFFKMTRSTEKQSLIVWVACCHPRRSLEVSKYETKNVTISFILVCVSRYILHSKQPQQGRPFQLCWCGQVKKGIHSAFHLASANVIWTNSFPKAQTYLLLLLEVTWQWKFRSALIQWWFSDLYPTKIFFYFVSLKKKNMILKILINCTVVIQLTNCKMQSFKHRKPFPLRSVKHPY